MVWPPLIDASHKPSLVRHRSVGAGLTVDNSRLSDARRFYREHYLGSQSDGGWTGSTAGCRVGENTSAHQAATLRRLNYFRALAGLPANVEFGEQYNRKALAAALMMEANSSLSHSPPSSWRCYTKDGAQAAGSSNLALGRGGPDSIDLYMWDPGAGNAFVGHRRWILHPAQRVMGSGSTSRANALWVFGEHDSQSRGPEFVAWPPAGYVSKSFGLRSDYRWSFSKSDADFSATQVRVTFNGRSVPVRLEPQRQGFGANTLVWTAHWSGNEISRPISVSLNNVRIGGQPRNFDYTVTFFDPSASDEPEPDPPAKDVIRPEFNASLIHAIATGDEDRAVEALTRGADPNAAKDGWSALLLAAYYGRESVVRELLRRGADRSAQIQGWTALAIAQYKNHSGIVGLLSSGERQARPRSAFPKP